MKKIIVFLVFSSFLFLSNCGYKSVYSKQSGNFHIKNIEIKTNNEINYKIKNRLKVFSNSNSGNKYDLEVNAFKSIKIVSKDSKGDPKIYQMNITVEVKLIENFKIIKENIFEEYFNYNNNSNKFELKQYEENIEDNLIEKIIENVTFNISNI
tara:strand:- start:348 stop:806 length:459 start_codon:yes stop_codon:yes gene_type:complete